MRLASDERAVVPATLLFVALSLLVSPSASAWQIRGLSDHVREDVMDPNYLVGTLTWENGAGAISWSGATSPGPAGPAKNAEADQQQYVASVTGVRASEPKPVVFTSEPLPFDLYINSSRNIHFDLMVVQPPTTERENGLPCPGGPWYQYAAPPAPQVGLYAAQDLVAGAGSIAPMDFFPQTDYWDADPANYDICRYRMAVEHKIIPAGQSLRLEISLPITAFRHYQYGTSAEFPSVIRIPYWTELEVLYRYTDTRAAMNEEADSEDPPAASAKERAIGGGLIGGLGIAGLTSLSPGRRRKLVAALVLALLLCVGFAGCFGGGKATTVAPTGSASSEFEKVNRTDLVGAETGAVLGLVHDDLRFPVPDAHVSLLGTVNFTRSDAGGRFQFRNMAPGTYTVRVDRSGFHPLESQVQIVAGTLTRLELGLVPLEAKKGDARAHHHDYWLEETSAQIFKQKLGKICTNQGRLCDPASTITIPKAGPGELPNTIRPGTDRVKVTVAWDVAAMGFEKIGLAIIPNHDINASYYMPRASPAVFNVATTWEMTDQGHQEFTTWEMYLYAAPDQSPKPSEPSYLTDAIDQYVLPVPEFDVTVEIQKGVVPLERPHPDHWGNETELDVAKQNVAGPSSSSIIVANALLGLGLLSNCAEQAWLHITVRPRDVIPPGTKWLEVVAKQNRETGQAGVGHYDWSLAYKPGNEPPVPYDYPTADMRDPNPTYRDAPKFEASNGNMRYAWKIPVEDKEADAVYAQRSAWMFAFYPSDQKAACIDTQTFAAYAPTAASIIAIRFSVVAHKEPMP